MTDVKAALTTLGWRVDTNTRLAQGIKDFQRAWNLGPQLAADGNAGPQTVAALETSLARKAQGLGDISPNFSAREWACQCGGKYADCRRIWSVRAIIRGAEIFRDKVGPFAPARPNRCPGENARVGGATRSQHLYGYALDVPVFKITVQQVRALGLFSGIGFYTYGSQQYVRHIDMRHLHGDPGTPSAPALWEYPGADKHTPQAVRPDLANPTPQPTRTPVQEDSMSAEDTARLVTIEATLKALADAEAGRYAVSSGRYSHLAGLSKGIADVVGAPVDEAAIASALGPIIADAVKVAAVEAGVASPGNLADAVVARLGEALTPKASA